MEEELNLLCIDKKCKSQGLICVICEELDHKKHDTIPLKNFIGILRRSVHNKTVGSMNSVAMLEKLRESTQAVVATRKREIDNKFTEISNEITRFFDLVDDHVKGLLHA